MATKFNCSGEAAADKAASGYFKSEPCTENMTDAQLDAYSMRRIRAAFGEDIEDETPTP